MRGVAREVGTSAICGRGHTYVREKYQNGKWTSCRECRRLTHNAWVAAGGERARKARRKAKDKGDRSDPSTWFAARKGHAARAAKARGLEFNITSADVIVPAVCPVLGLPLVFGGGKGHPMGPSIDRIDNTKGYVPGNVWVISNRANRIKGDATVDELFAVGSAIAALGSTGGGPRRSAA